jgi:hypothetical protein
VRGDAVLRWADEIIATDPHPPAAFFDIVTVDPADLSGMRHALWPLTIEPDPQAVLESILGRLSGDIESGRRGLADTLTVVRQMRSMLRLPPALYAALNAALVAHAADREPGSSLRAWLRQFEPRSGDFRP